LRSRLGVLSPVPRMIRSHCFEQSPNCRWQRFRHHLEATQQQARKGQ
jgi:hypothetical protein